MTELDEKLFISYAFSGRTKDELKNLESELYIFRKQFVNMGFGMPFCSLDYENMFKNLSYDSIMEFCCDYLDKSSKVILYVDKILESSGVAKEIELANSRGIDVILFKNRIIDDGAIQKLFSNYDFEKVSDTLNWDNDTNTEQKYREALMASKTFGKVARKTFLYEFIR